jgi:N-acetylmuramoyl-L-alanine amidase
VAGDRADAKSATEHYSSAYRRGAACDTALLAAALAAEEASSASAGYLELYRLTKVARQDCALAMRLEQLRAFRPEAALLAQVDAALQGQGEGPIALADASVAVTGSANVVKIERFVTKEDARVVITMSKPVAYRVADDATVAGKPRTYVDLDGAGFAGLQASKNNLQSAGIVTLVRSEATVSGARISMELDGRAYRKVFHLSEPYRIVVDIARNAPKKPGRSIGKVVLDAGHGGSDPGAIGPTGLREKDVTLSIVKHLAPMLAGHNIDVVLTRDEDAFVSLEERTARANASRADLFVSVHCNASEGHAKKGLETYVLDTSIDDMAGRLAARENATSPLANAELSSILASMRMADQAQRSTHLAELVQKSVLASLKPAYAAIVDGGVHTAGFFVLVGARMPAVLVESTYISNPEESALLAEDSYRKRIAAGLANAVLGFRDGK